MTRLHLVQTQWLAQRLAPFFSLVSTPRLARQLAQSGVFFALLGSVACGDLVGDAALPTGTQSPNTYNTPDGAVALYRGAKASLGVALKALIVRTGALTDELVWGELGSVSTSVGATGDNTDERILEEGDSRNVENIYGLLHGVRTNAMQGLGLLTAYAPALSPALRGEMYTLQGYAEVLLAELYCSGIPLSTLDFQGDFTYKPGSTTDEVYAHATALFDSALAISSDSASVMALARIGKARVLLRQGQYAAAAAAVASVPTSFQYQISVKWGIPEGYEAYPFKSWTVATREGGNGVPFYTNTGTLLTWNDPRSWVIAASPATNTFGVPQFAPAKYPINTVAPIVLASGVEARLIEAEAALHAGDPNWLTTLNTLRTDSTFSFPYQRLCQPGIPGPPPQVGSPCPATPNIDTTWGAGTGIGLISAAVLADNVPVCPASGACTDTVWYRGLKPLTDPGLGVLPVGKTVFDVRLDLILQERAYWLFLTGTRQGDLRRLVHTYGRPQEVVYPTGAYLGGFGFYGEAVNLPVPAEERINRLYTGCFDREA